MHHRGTKSPAPKKRLLIRLSIALVLWMIIIFISSSLPASAFPEVDSIIYAKLVHLFYYAVLGGLVWRLLRAQHRWPFLRKHAAISGIVAAVIYGASDEIHQRFTMGRHALLSDVLIDGAGATLFVAGVAVAGLLRKGAMMRRVNDFCPACVPAGHLLRMYHHTMQDRIVRLFLPVERVRCDRCGREDWAWQKGGVARSTGDIPPGVLLVLFLILIIAALVVKP